MEVPLKSIHIFFGGPKIEPVRPETDLRVYGGLELDAVYQTLVTVGSPPQEVSLILDTGSSLTAFACRTCSNCGTHQHESFDPDLSKTRRPIHVSECEGPASVSWLDDQCVYQISYTEGSQLKGTFFSDEVGLGSLPGRALLGCHQMESSIFRGQKADGIMGLRPSAHFNLLTSLGVSQYALCLTDQGGRLRLNPLEAPTFWTPIAYFRQSQIHIWVTRLELDGWTLGSSLWGFLDSGNTLTEFPTKVYWKVKDALEAFCRNNEDCGLQSPLEVPLSFEPNFRVHPGPEFRLDQLPPLWFEVEGYRIPWRSYLIPHGKDLILGFRPSSTRSQYIVLGSTFMINQDITIDSSNHLVGFRPSCCPGDSQLPCVNSEYPEAPAFSGWSWEWFTLLGILILGLGLRKYMRGRTRYTALPIIV